MLCRCQSETGGGALAQLEAARFSAAGAPILTVCQAHAVVGVEFAVCFKSSTFSRPASNAQTAYVRRACTSNQFSRFPFV